MKFTAFRTALVALFCVAIFNTAARAELLPHPAGCPRVKFCGCGASVKVFGHSVRSLWLAAAWLQFRRANAAPGRVAVRRDGHHVMVLKAHIKGQFWQVYDANSGGHATRRHVRSIAGYIVVGPYTRATQ